MSIVPMERKKLCGKVGDGAWKGRRRISGGVSQPHTQMRIDMPAFGPARSYAGTHHSNRHRSGDVVEASVHHDFSQSVAGSPGSRRLPLDADHRAHKLPEQALDTDVASRLRDVSERLSGVMSGSCQRR
jgi:hypothetical protein